MSKSKSTNKFIEILRKHHKILIVLTVVTVIIAAMIYLPVLIVSSKYKVKPQINFKKIDNPNVFQSNYILKINGGTNYYYETDTYGPYIMKFFEDTGVQVYLLDINLGTEGMTRDDVANIIQQNIKDPYGLYFTDAHYDNDTDYDDIKDVYWDAQVYKEIYYGEELNKQLNADARQTIINCWHSTEESVFDPCWGAEAFIKSLDTSRVYLAHPLGIYLKRSIKWVLLLGFISYKIYKKKRREYIEETKDILKAPLESLQNEYAESLKNKYHNK